MKRLESSKKRALHVQMLYLNDVLWGGYRPVAGSTCTNVVFKLGNHQQSRERVYSSTCTNVVFKYRYIAEINNRVSSTCTNVVFKSLICRVKIIFSRLYMYKCCI